MDKSTLLRYKGYLETSTLLKTIGLSGIDQIKLGSESDLIGDEFEFKNQRLGKLVEEFVFCQLQQQASVKWIVENLQIQKERKTIGELDALYFQGDKPIHLEVVYKFYLYDSLNTYNEPLAYWIGPNRKDSLCYKLEKLKIKQFPLLFNNETTNQLLKYNIDTAGVSQKLCFKAQLFLPYNNPEINIEPLNENCICGFYISFNAISTFKTLQFYIPQKLDWLVICHNDVFWEDYETAKIKIQEEIEDKRSPLVWLKYSETKFVKCFITFW
ncbi:hypothetical protein ADIWIN_3735 [Winogradskyella psychrotolerans RS-3]|uniref:DUF1853 domain-containing protein n=1 Tax=Winogradskyella psychrotolerans RS-3 TaxID=641526 RepID=S7WUE4_9FLAO|nr:DUF1853 family protein [Winogradskyella psychrotolerans]EPR70379.1 hypothetical protein ADIWIN_3735 [Winogradskyella psychrotolerans RS-3]